MLGDTVLPRLRGVLVLLLGTVSVVHGSGSMYDPPNRAVMWKYGFSSPKDYNYMQLNCGGKKVRCNQIQTMARVKKSSSTLVFLFRRGYG